MAMVWLTRTYGAAQAGMTGVDFETISDDPTLCPRQVLAFDA
jgi:hypothetical protein